MLATPNASPYCRSMLEANPAILRLDITSPTYAVKIDYLRGLLQVRWCSPRAAMCY